MLYSVGNRRVGTALFPAGSMVPSQGLQHIEQPSESSLGSGSRVIHVSEKQKAAHVYVPPGSNTEPITLWGWESLILGAPYHNPLSAILCSGINLIFINGKINRRDNLISDLIKTKLGVLNKVYKCYGKLFFCQQS